MQPDDEQVFKLLERLDHAPPKTTAQDVISAAQQHKHGWRKVAVIVLATAAVSAAAYAIPGSPIRRWVEGSRNEPTPQLQTNTAISDPGGVMLPADQRVVIEFGARSSASHARISLTNDASIVVRTDARAATFTSDGDRLLINNPATTAATFTIEIPRNAVYLEIRVAGKRVFLKDGDAINGAFNIPLS